MKLLRTFSRNRESSAPAPARARPAAPRAPVQRPKEAERLSVKTMKEMDPSELVEMLERMGSFPCDSSGYQCLHDLKNSQVSANSRRKHKKYCRQHSDNNKSNKIPASNPAA